MKGTAKLITMDSNATNSSTQFSVKTGTHLAIETYVAADSSPTGAFSLERLTPDGSWMAYDTEDATFADPAGGAASGTVNVTYPVPGIYRLTYTSSSGGAAGAITGVVRRGFA